jgi:hypothetical protein
VRAVVASFNVHTHIHIYIHRIVYLPQRGQIHELGRLLRVQRVADEHVEGDLSGSEGGAEAVFVCR